MENDSLKFSVRPATEDDLDAILKIEDKSYPTPWTKTAFLEEMQKPFSNVLVYTDDETDAIIAGYIVFWTMFEECHILNVAVSIDWRGLGFGIKLVRLAMNQALKKGCKKIILEVRKDNTNAIQLYQKLGFFTDSIKKGFYSNGDDAYFMTRFIDQSTEF